jgi:hypothetical protein
MKIPVLVWFLSASTLSAAGPTLPSFSEKLFDRHELSFSEPLKAVKFSLFDSNTEPADERLRRESPVQRRLTSRMPIIKPSTDVDPAMPVGAPRADIDLKMIVKEPSVDSTN